MESSREEYRSIQRSIIVRFQNSRHKETILEAAREHINKESRIKMKSNFLRSDQNQESDGVIPLKF